MKVEKIIDMYNALVNLSKHDKLPFSVALTIAENLDILEIPAKVAEQKRKEIALRNVVKDGDGNPVVENGVCALIENNTYAEEISEMLSEDAKIYRELSKIKKSDMKCIDVSVSEIRPIVELFE